MKAEVISWNIDYMPFIINSTCIRTYQWSSSFLVYKLDSGPKKDVVALSAENKLSDRSVFPLAKGSLRWNAPLKIANLSERINACSIGCKDLDSPNSNCSKRCSSTNATDSCLQGCQAIADIFMHLIQGLLNNMTANIETENEKELLILWQLDNTYQMMIREISAMNIQWAIQSRQAFSNLPFITTPVQQKAFKDDSMMIKISIPNNYIGQVELRFCAFWRFNIIVSPISIHNLSAEGSSPNAPEIIAQQQISLSSYVVCWNTEHPRIYRLSLSDLDGTELFTENTTLNCFLFKNIPSENCCRASIGYANFNSSADTVIKIELITISDSSQKVSSRLVFTNGTHLLELHDVNDYVVKNPPQHIPFETDSKASITALCSFSRERLYIGLNDGSVFWINIGTNEEANLLRQADDNPVLHIDIDHMQEKVYIVLMKQGILRCDLDRCDNGTVMTENAINYIEYISVDAFNGYIYCVAHNGELLITPLFPYNSSETTGILATKKLAAVDAVSAVEIDYENMQLIIVAKNGSIFGMNLVNRSLSDLRSSFSVSGEYVDVKKVHFMQNRMFWTVPSCGILPLLDCLYSEEYDNDNKNIHLNQYLFAGRVVDFTFMKERSLPLTVLPPNAVGLITSSDLAVITWQPPPLLPFQSKKFEWRNVYYKCGLMSESEDQNNPKLTTSNSTAEILPITPGLQYHASVQACICNVCSALTSAINSAFMPHIDPPFVMINRTNDQLNIYSLLGTPLDNYAIDSPLPAELNIPFALDPTTQSLYTVIENESNIYRTTADGTRTLFLETVTARYLAILPTYSVLVLASDYVIRSYRFTSTFQQTLTEFRIYSCDSITGCGSVFGLAGDDDTGDIFFLIQNLNNTVSLFGINQHLERPYFISSSSDFPPIRQMLVAKEKLAFVTTGGEIGICDKKLGSLNLNLAAENVVLVQNTNISAIHALNFTTSRAVVNPKRDKLTWNVESFTSADRLLFKISLYKENWDGEKFVNYSFKQEFYLSPQILESWSSRQTYDVRIDAISAWNTISINYTSLTAPTKPPTAPTNLRVFATQQKTVDGARALIDLFWDEPIIWNGEKTGYIVNCTVDAGDRWSAVVLPVERTYSFNVKSGSVSCIVGARTETALITFSEPITIDSSELRPLVRVFAVDASNKLVQVYNSSLSSLPLSKRQTATSAITQQSIAYIGNDLYALRNDADITQPYLLRLDSNNVDYVVQKVTLAGNIAEVDAIISDWVANRLLFISGGNLLQLFLDLLDNSSVSVFTPRQVMNLSLSVGDAKQLLFDPFNNTAYLLTKNGSLFALYLNKNMEENLAVRFNCLKTETVTAMVSNFIWNRAVLDSIVVLTWNGLSRLNFASSACEIIDIDDSIFGERKLKAVLSFGVFGTKYLFTTSTSVIEYDGNTKQAIPIEVSGVPLKQILIATQSSQPYPDRSCFVYPDNIITKFTIMNEQKTGAEVNIKQPALPSDCPAISLPPTQYEIRFKRKDTDKVTSILTLHEKSHIENGLLDKETDYEVTVAFRNRYTNLIESSVTQLFITGYGYPTAPLVPAAVAVSPDSVILFWNLPAKANAPLSEIKYRVSHMSELLSLPAAIGALEYNANADGDYADALSDVVSCTANPCSAKLLHLHPATDYKFWVRAIHKSHLESQYEDPEAITAEIPVRTKDTPGTLRPENITSTSVTLHWVSLEPESPPLRISIEYRVVDDKTVSSALNNSSVTWKSPADASFEWSHPVTIVIEGLLSATAYEYRYTADYKETFMYTSHPIPVLGKYYHAPQQIKTKPGTPSAPATLQLIYDYEGLVVRWTPPLSNGGTDIVSYALEYRPNDEADWEIAERGLGFNDSEWRPPKLLSFEPEVEFRIRASNSEGFGEYAYSKQPQSADDETFPLSLWVVALSILVASVVTACVFIALLVYYRHHERKLKRLRVLQIGLRNIDSTNPQMELPQNFMSELKNIPRVAKDCVNVKNVLGAGTFGEVFEGVVSQPSEKGVLVAIKVTRLTFMRIYQKYAFGSPQCFSNFDHPNIVRLLGISIESDPYYLIMELMEAGDLLSFLKSSRPTDILPSQLSLSELVAMMVDVGRGAAYLEANRFVHKDLAARNCLISSKIAPRTTKIADFGLAQTVYKGEYCRLNGEELLPLRWLAPEIIIGESDGAFTSKTDVWSFGVLLWEIMTLGQQPYFGKDQFEVRLLIREGITLEKPETCPEDIFAIIRKTWLFDPGKRPSFADLLPELENLQESSHYLDEKPYPPSSSLPFLSTSAFESSIESNTSCCGSADRSINSRFDKSDNHTGKKQGRPSVLRSLKKERQKVSITGDSTLTELDQRTFSNETLETYIDDRRLANGYDNEGFASSYDNTNDSTNQSVQQQISKDASKSQQFGCSFTNSFSSVDTQSFNDSNSSYFRTARVSRV
uniref:receptor protein-tyrosine kinase n=1 Tax=Syphacia muris TaxID=451379 RepID=A0A158R4X9_9BILA